MLALDACTHHRLARKLGEFGITRVSQVNPGPSSLRESTGYGQRRRGVPQGSVLGPVLLLTFLTVIGKLFADDVKL